MSVVGLWSLQFNTHNPGPGLPCLKAPNSIQTDSQPKKPDIVCLQWPGFSIHLSILCHFLSLSLFLSLPFSLSVCLIYGDICLFDALRLCVSVSVLSLSLCLHLSFLSLCLFLCFVVLYIPLALCPLSLSLSLSVCLSSLSLSLFLCFTFLSLCPSLFLTLPHFPLSFCSHICSSLFISWKM